MSRFEVLVDSDALIGWSLTTDAHHERSCQIFQELATQNKKLLITSAVIIETATVLSHLAGQDIARRFLKNTIQASSIPIIFIDEKLHAETLEYFSLQERRGTSFTDCANVVVMKHFEIPTIFSFDRAYSRDFGVEVIH